ncbi:MAG: glycine--tRNA ligase [Erysipelotrichaceae bacterium]|nr:glycine--tRNA ligase [Erysipelotrichaceae bacterium]MDD3923512.1 glycine--tRNA ligase [Erysipelotrichaceae bacterium]MDD4642534.1 glycine--tRNA ligase [Erysipelotrichaceae bacterium]
MSGKEKYSFEKIVNHLRNNGFVYQGSEIYGGLANTWDFGPLGVALKNNIKEAWRYHFIQKDPNNIEIQSAILMNPQVWVASGHLRTFADPLMDCRNCNTRHRADQLIETTSKNTVNPTGWSNSDMMDYIIEHKIKCPQCGSHDFTDIRQFNLMFKTFQGVIEDAKNTIYLRPETAQGMFVNFKNVQRFSRKKIPFGIGQIGKSFRNEITPGNFIFRTREFEQMELEFFCKPNDDLKWYEYWKKFCFDWLITLGINQDNIRLREHTKEELSHYSKGTSDIEYAFSFGWGEIWGIADRTDFDLANHQNHSKQSLEYYDNQTDERYLPYCIEPAVGVERLFLAFISDAYSEEVVNDTDIRVLLKLHPALAPIKLAILPLSKQLNDQAMNIYQDMIRYFACDYDDSGSIGKRYRRNDAIGTPFCLTYDFDSQTDESVTIRHRDTMEQVRIKIVDVKDYVEGFLQY